MNMVLEPGMDVSVQKLSERYGVSRTPVREAIVRLQQLGLVEVYPKRKTVVSEIDLQRVYEEGFIRMSLESAVVDDFITHCSGLVIDTMQELIKKQKKYISKENFKEFYAIDNRFHKLIFETAKKTLAWLTIEEVTSHYNRVRLLQGKRIGVEAIGIDNHEQMVEAARKGDADALRRIMLEHSNHHLAQVKSMFEQYPQFFK